MTFWEFVEHDASRPRPRAHELGGSLLELHAALADFPGELGPLSDVRDWLDRLVAELHPSPRPTAARLHATRLRFEALPALGVSDGFDQLPVAADPAFLAAWLGPKAAARWLRDTRLNMPHDKVELAKRVIDAYNRRDVDTLFAELATPDFEWYPAIVRALDGGGGYRGREGVDRFAADTSENWAELQIIA